MRKTLLFIFALILCITTFGQATKFRLDKMPAKAPNTEAMGYETAQSKPVSMPSPAQAPLKGTKETNFVSVIPIGTSANAFGHFVGSRTANIGISNSLNTIVYTHRLQSPSGNYIGYDVSFDRGLTWQTNQVNYNPTLPGYSNARYPLGGLYNPDGNTDPQNAYHTYVAPLLDGSLGTSGSWGGIGYGAKKFATGSTGAQNKFTSSGPIHWFLPSAFTIQANGTAWFIDERTQWDGSTSTFDGMLNVARGTFNEDTGIFDYDVEEWPFDVHPDDGINDIEIAFSPDGMTGWICLLTNTPNELPYTSYHPILFKTTDGGETWSDAIEVQLGGVNGLDGVKQFITDEALEAFFSPDPVPSRDEIGYYIGYYHDLVVDAWGNPHIQGNVMLADIAAGSIYTGPSYNAPFHIWSPDGGTTWKAYKLANIHQFKAEFTEGGSTVSHYNHNQISTTPDGTIVFFSWLDCDIEDATDNTRPDIYFCDFIPYAPGGGSHSEAENVTIFSPAMWKANWANMPDRVFAQATGTNSVEYTIPWVYMSLDNTYNGSNPVQFNYIPNFKKTYAVTALNEFKGNEIATVSQNQPNPFRNETTVQVTLLKNAPITLEVYSLTGQKISSQEYANMQAGTHKLTIDGSQMVKGVYFYTLSTGSQKITKKMIVE